MKEVNTNETDAREMAEQIKKLPEPVQQKIQYMIQGALLLASSQKRAV